MPDRIVLEDIPQTMPSSAFLASVVGDDGVPAILLRYDPEASEATYGDKATWERAAQADRLLYNVVHRAAQGCRLYAGCVRQHVAMLEF